MFLVCGAALVLGTFSFCCWLFLWSKNPGIGRTTKAVSPPTPPTKVIASGNPRGYVGIQACEACHAARVKEFKETRHYLACMPPDPFQMPAAFSKSGEGQLDTS